MSTAEVTYGPPFELWKTDHGIDGWDAKTWLVAKFTTRQKAVDYLTAQGFTYEAGPNRFEHNDVRFRHTMGKISYEIRDARPAVPVDPVVEAPDDPR